MSVVSSRSAEFRNAILDPIVSASKVISDPFIGDFMYREVMEAYIQQFSRMLDVHSDKLSDVDYDIVIHVMADLQSKINQLD